MRTAEKKRPMPRAVRKAAGLLKGKLMYKYMVSFSRNGTKAARQRTFFELAKRHIVKGRKGGRRDLSRKIDEVVYGN